MWGWIALILVVIYFRLELKKEKEKRKQAERSLQIKIDTSRISKLIKENNTVSGKNIAISFQVETLFQAWYRVQIRDLTRDLTRNLTLAQDLALIRALAQALDLARTLALTLARNRALIQARDRAQDLIRAQNLAQDLAQTLAQDLVQDLNLPLDLDLSLDLPLNLDRALPKIINIVWIILNSFKTLQVQSDKLKKISLEVEKLVEVFPICSIKKTLGEGAQGKVFLVNCRMQDFALKIFAPNDLFIVSGNEVINQVYKRFQTEILVKKLEHENVVKIEHFFERIFVKQIDKESKEKTLELPAYTMQVYNENIKEYLDREKEKRSIEKCAFDDLELALDLFKYLIDTATGIKYIHSEEIIHRDIKPANIMLKDGKAAIGDFGIARWHDFKKNEGQTISLKTADPQGTPFYMAPEIETQKYKKSADIYSFGITILELLFFTRDPRSIPRYRKNCKVEKQEIIMHILDLIEQMCDIEPDKRPNIDGVKKVLMENYKAIRKPFTKIHNEQAKKLVKKGLFENLSELIHLTRFDLEGTQVSDTRLVHIKNLDNLITLYLSRTKVSDAGLVHIKNLTNLTELYLSSTKVSDAGLVHIKNLNNLTELYLSHTQVSDAGLAHLKNLNNLNRLDLRNTQVSDAGLVHIKNLDNLTELYLSYTQVSNAGIEKLEEALPNCEITGKYDPFS